MAVAISAVALAILGPLAALAVAASSAVDGGSGINVGASTTAPVAGAPTVPTTASGPTAPAAGCRGTAPSLGSSTPVTQPVATTVTSPVSMPTTIVQTTTTVASTTPPATPEPTAPTAATTTTPTTTSPANVIANPCPVAAPPTAISVPAGNPFAANGMWIWELASTDRGNVPAIAAHAREYGIGTVMVKAGDGTTWWPQFSPATVRTLHAWGLRVCAWQFVYGAHPLLEAGIGARAVKDGANCLVIDAESQYQGLYVQAQSYISSLRRRIGSSFPVALAGFPFVDYHPSFPYSVFLGPHGAQYNAPQMYWRDIGTTVAAVYSHTYAFNELYQRPIFPLGQLFDSPPSWQIGQFRQVARYYGAKGVSWWDWQSAGTSQFQAIWSPIGSIVGFVPQTTVASVGRGAKGDVVVWAQEHLIKAGLRIAVDGDFAAQTQRAVSSFQSAHHLAASGVINPATWNALLRYQARSIKWTLAKRSLSAVVASAGVETLAVPRSASLAAKRDELGHPPGQGSPSTASR